MLPIVKIANAHIPNDRFLDAKDLDDDPLITSYFKKKVAELKKEASDVNGRKIAPKANGFLYFTCIMMHAAEASSLDDNGNLKKTADGNDVKVWWDKRADGSWIWNSNDSSIMPYKNSNADIFPEQELKKAYKKWVGKPLCLDHKSQSVDMIRGIVVDTVYDDKKKRIIALCALDKENHPDLARKVASGYAASVSMGTAVGKAICTEKGCHRVARVESEFCEHMRAKSCYGEINVDLSPIELSIVVNGADPKAKIRRVISAADRVAKYEDRTTLNEAGITVDDVIQEAIDVKRQLEEKIDELREEVGDNKLLDIEDVDPYAQRGNGPRMNQTSFEESSTGNVPQAANTARYAQEMSLILSELREKIGKLNNFINKMASVKESNNKFNEDTVMVNQKNAYFQGGGGVNEPTPKQVKYPKEDSDTIRDTQDKQMTGAPPFPEVGSTDDMYGDDESKKRELQRMAAEAQHRGLRRQSAMEKAKELIKQRREAYFQGGGDVNEPTPGKVKYPNETDYTKIRDKEDKQMTGNSPFPSVGKTDGLYGDDESQKKKLLRAKLQARFVKASNEDGSDNYGDCQWNIYAKDDVGKSRLIMSTSVNELAGPKNVKKLYAGIATQDYGRKIIDVIRSEGLDAAKSIFKGAQDAGDVFNQFGPDQNKVREVMNTMECKGPGDTAFRPCTEDEAKMYAASNGNIFGYEFRKKATASTRNVMKRAQQAPAVPGGAPAAPPAAGAPAALPTGNTAPPADLMGDMGADMGMGAEGDLEPGGETGSPIDQIQDYVRELGNIHADLEKAVEALEDEDESGDLDEMPEGDVAGMATPAAPTTATASVSVGGVRKTLSHGMRKGMKQAQAELQDMIDELKLIERVSSDGLNSSLKMTADLLKDAKSDINSVKKNAYKMMASFVRYAKAVENLTKVAQDSTQKVPTVVMPGDTQGSRMPTNPPSAIRQPAAPPVGQPVGQKGGPAPQITDVNNTDENFDKLVNMMAGNEDKEDSNDLGCGHEMGDSNDLKFDNVEEANEFFKMKGAAARGIANMSREERDVLRVKLAQKGVQFSDMLQKAHPSGGFTTDLDVKPEGNLAEVEDLLGSHKQHMDVATSAPRNVRMAAEKIQKLVLAGEIDPRSDFPGLIAEGLDPAAITYWKKLWGEAHDPEASKWVGELVKDHKNKKAAVAETESRVKVARAYELAYAMAERGLITRDPNNLRQQVDKILSYNEDNFTHLRETVGRIPVKTASIPEVGVHDSIVTATDYFSPPLRDESNDLKGLFDQAFAGRKY